MERADIFNKVCEIASDVLGVAAEDVTEETTFDTLDADSLDRLQLVTGMEDEFDLELPDDQLESINSVADAVNALAAALEA